MTTVAWGEGSTFTLLGGEIKNVTPGSLFAASYVDGELVEGHPISSRPAKLKFNYKYKPYKSDKFVVTVILENNTEGTIVEKTVQVPDAKDLFTSYELDFSSYITDEAKNKIKAERIKIYFRAGVNSTKKAVQGVRGSDGALKGYADSKRIGSVLTIDDIELIYE